MKLRIRIHRVVVDQALSHSFGRRELELELADRFTARLARDEAIPVERLSISNTGSRAVRGANGLSSYASAIVESVANSLSSSTVPATATEAPESQRHVGSATRGIR